LFGRCFTSWVAEVWPGRHDFIVIDSKTARRPTTNAKGSKPSIPSPTPLMLATRPGPRAKSVLDHSGPESWNLSRFARLRQGTGMNPSLVAASAPSAAALQSPNTLGSC
jgi:hypothetical protein